MATNSSSNEVIVAMVPFPGYGHVNPLFALGRLIASHNITVHFLGLPHMNQELKPRIQNDVGASNIHFHDLHVASPSPGDDSGIEGEVMFRKIGESASKICVGLANTGVRRLVIVHDNITRYYVWEAIGLSNVESYLFHISPAFVGYFMHVNSVEIPGHDGRDELLDEFPPMEDCFGKEKAMHAKMEHEWTNNFGTLVDSCRVLEGKYLDLYADANGGKPVWAVGPLNMMLESHESISLSNSTSSPRHECLEFLDKQEVNSVIFVSFGTTTTMSQEQINEIALGLERSNHKFIWVIREANDSEAKDGKIGLPEGFEERVEGRGLVARSLVPQVEILKHPSTGGFVSHCGWNSCIESISMGVPVGTWPFIYDQPCNAIYLTNFLKIGVTVRSWDRRDELVTSPAIEEAVKTLMGSTEGDEMRRRAAELSNKIKNSVSHGGLARKEMESFVSHIIRS